MHETKLLLITGLPASGKSTLAQQLGTRYCIPVIAKDAIKEPLFDVLGAADPAQSRKLSDASFAVMFALARELLAARVSCVLEGNFRPGEHERALAETLPACEHGSAALDAHGPASHEGASSHCIAIAQVLCRIDEAERLLRLSARAADTARHPGHRDSELAKATVPATDGFLSLAGERFLYEGERTLAALDVWFRR